jgi:plastocyanin
MAGSFLVGIFLLLSGTELSAAELQVAVVDANGNPLADAVVSATPLEASTGAAADTAEPLPGAVIAQQNLQFVPRVTAIRRGAAVRFPNRDNILHNVYSFSKAKKFQLPLYRDEPPGPVIFDEPGVVVLGCNIHDWMVAYIYVLDTPYFASTGTDGGMSLVGLPGGDYTVEAWHPRMKKRGSTPALQIELGAADSVRVELTVALKPAWRKQAPPQDG